MTRSVCQIITVAANQAAAVALSTFNGIPECAFIGLATTEPSGTGDPTHCWCNGPVEDTVIALFEADPVNYKVTRFPNRQAAQALIVHDPRLYPWVSS